jgi:acyl-[acyl-carrier-protein]-phospholipid O-acyltransferase/long-chain-fatty-acid--[acyl-carrier-protein] ligase
MSETSSISNSSAGRPWKRGFWSLIATQFQGAFSDMALKNLVIFMGLSLGLSQAQRDGLVPLAQALLSLPFILFSMLGGYFANRFSKRNVTIGVKVFEIAIMFFALAALASNNLAMGLSSIFFMGMHSAIFGPSKYGLLPELLPEKRLSWGNGILELGTFLAIITGTVGGTILSQTFFDRPAWSGIILIGLAVFGLSASFSISQVPPANPAKTFRVNFLADLWEQVRIIRRDRVLSLAVIGNTYFWSLGALLSSNIILYSVDVLKADQTHTGYLQVALAIGIGLGSLAAGCLSGGKIEYGLIPLGALGMTGFAASLSQPELSFFAVAANLAFLGFFGGFFAVPLNALMQHRPNKEDRGGVLAAQNLLSSAGVFLAQGIYFLLKTGLQLDPGTIFLLSALVTLGGTIYVLYLLPDAFLRLLLWLLTHTVYRIRVEGRDNIPEKGGALFVSNHLSLIDALLLLASTDRFVRFIMYKGIYDKPWIKPFARILRGIPISSQVRPREMITALREATNSIKRGEVVCIFAEGQITRIGQMLPFKRGFEQIMKDVDAPIIPIALDGVWGSIFSFEKRRFYWKIPRRFPYPVTVAYGKPMPSDSRPFAVRQAVQELQSEAWRHRKPRMLTVTQAFVQTARHHPFRIAMADASTPKVTFSSALARTIFLARRLRPIWQGQEKVGLLLPPSVPGALVNFAALLMGKVPVNLNYTVSEEVIASCIRQCGIQTVVTSKAFLDKIKLKLPGQPVFLEELTRQPRVSEQLGALMLRWLCPAAWLEKALGAERKAALDDLATIIFSSGSTGVPKGVMLSHYNIASNVEQLGQTFALGPKDRILGILPFFHSFGFTGALCLPASLGVGVVFHPNPLDAKAIGPLVRDYAITFLLATPTFLQMYLRTCEPEDFGSLQFVMAGAEKLPERVAAAFEEKFGIRPVEGYGCTECSPAVTVNTHDFRAAGFRQVGAKRGKIGHPLPGVSVRIVDPDTMEPRPMGQAGLLLVHGPNVMQGYLGQPEKTAAVLRDGWYVTGDIATLDEDGFLQITDRLSRFSKIGGEMVPHIKVEEKLQELAGATEQTFAVTGIPDDSKGERLVVLHLLSDDKLKLCVEKLSQSDLPNLWIPRPNQFFRVESLPYLGTGKLDLRRIREMAVQFSMAT